MDIIFVPLLLLFKALVGLAIAIVVSDVVLSWLMVANILNTKNQFIYAMVSSISKISDFMLRPIRVKMPITLGALDISPLVLILLLIFVENVINRVLMRLA